MRDNLLLHYAIVLIVSGFLTFFSAGLWPQFSFFFQWLVNFATYAAVFTVGHLIGRLLDRGKYDD
ncbi:hypothetical protein ACFQ1E_18735 [Sphingomonas canadensis]|uniref:Uncharacterized protein n=2 Tax=Sphingomonas canadensis TaxID=1219257 RepID=A0ABW3HFB6_9SPHN|nr:hypothetical protein [Sphingomonas canadensis]